MFAVSRCFTALVLLFCFSMSAYSQSLSNKDLQNLLLENPSILKESSEFKKFERNGINSKSQKQNMLASENKVIPNADNELLLNLNTFKTKDKLESVSILKKYFENLSGDLLNIYGSNEFNQTQDENILFFNTPGKNYQLAPGDEIQVTITGQAASNNNYRVQNDGTITLENMYPLNVDNLRLDQVNELILEKILLDDASSNVFVRLNSARLVTVQISGNVNTPKTIAVPAYTPLSRVIAYSGGISDSGSLRNIILSQIGSKNQSVDFYDFLQNASLKNDPLVNNGARIFVPNKGSTIAVTGFVSKPGIYELPNGQTEATIKEMLNFTGTSFFPPGTNLKIAYFDTLGQTTTRQANLNDSIKQGEALVVDFVATRELNASKVSGSVLEEYTLKTNKSLSIKEVLKNGSVLSDEAYKPLALIAGGEVPIVVNINHALSDENIILPVGANLIIFTREEFFSLVDENPNTSRNPLVSKLAQSNIITLYINDNRHTYVAIKPQQKFIPIKEVLKTSGLINNSGKIIDDNIYTSFAIIMGEKVQAINLNDALSDDNITLPAGADLRLFTKAEYLNLVAEDPNDTANSLISSFVGANIAEIYLNGVRIAYVPVNLDHEFSESINGFYNPSAKTVYNLSLIENSTGIEAFNLRTAMNKKGRNGLAKGDRLFIFEDKFYDELINDNFLEQSNSELPNKAYEVNKDVSDNLSVDLEAYMLQQDSKNKALKYTENINYLKRILEKANVVRVSLDGELFSILPFYDGIKSSNIIDSLNGRFPKLVNEFVIVQNINLNINPKIKSLESDFEINPNQELNLITQGTYRKLVENYDGSDGLDLIPIVKESDAVKVYYDNELVLLLPPNIHPARLNAFDKIIESDKFYKLFIGFESKQKTNGSWSLNSYDLTSFFSIDNKIKLSASNVINLFSKQYIRERFTNLHEEKNISVGNRDSEQIDNIETTNMISNSVNNFNTKVEEKKHINDKIIGQKKELKETLFAHMNSQLRIITGSVMFPGQYPVAKNVKLVDLIEVAGLISTTSTSNVIINKTVRKKNRLVKLPLQKFSLSDLKLNQIILNGEYMVELPKAINDSISGFITLSGEVLVPGRFSFTREETLDSILQRAKGLTNTAYPLGAVLERKSIQAQEKASNNILASQLEASILTLAQSDIDGVGEQIKAVLGFAQQLRNQPTTGRMTLNVMENYRTSPLYLEDGDKLYIPKRPSHVSVIGAVQKMTVASYAKDKTYKEYVLAAGGVTKIANIRKSYVLLPNGESRILDQDTIIPAGSVIVIPAKIDKLSALGLADIVSRVLGNIATSILAINNVN